MGRPPTHLIFTQYDERLARLNRTSGYRKNFRIATRHYEAYLATVGVGPTEAESWVVEEFLAAANVAPTTKRAWHAMLRAAYKYALRRQQVKVVPTYDIAFENVPEPEPTVLTNEELRQIKNHCGDSRHWLLFHLLAYTGMRRAEVTNLTWEAVNFAANTIKVLGKGGKRRLVPIHPALSEALIEAPPVPGRAIFPGPYGKPLSSTRMHWILKEFAPNARFHDFRRTVASSLYYNGVQGDTIDRILGWKRRDVRSRYYVRVADEQLQAAILRVYADDPV